ncbi:ESX secretion-associated protein EspG [Nocardia sp. NPDC003693]
MLTPDEFALVWTRETHLERRPYPLDTLPARAENPTAAPRLRHQYLHRTDPELTAALMLCARTDHTTVTLYGERTGGPDPRRILAFAAVAQQRAGILVALPDAVSVQICPADQLGRELVEIIGSAPPGTLATMREPQNAVLRPDGSAPSDVGGDDFRRKLREPVDGRGFITVSVEPANPFSPPTKHRTWLDFSGDGRYLLTTATDLTLTPISDEELAEHLGRLARV